MGGIRAHETLRGHLLGSRGNADAEDTIYLVRAPDFRAAVEDVLRNTRTASADCEAKQWKDGEAPGAQANLRHLTDSLTFNVRQLLRSAPPDCSVMTTNQRCVP